MPSILNATTTNGLVTSADNSGSLQLQTNNGTTAVTIDTSQNVGIGTSSPAFVNGTSGLQVNGSSSPAIRLTSPTASLELVSATSASFVYGTSNTPVVFGTNNTERMRIDASGNLLVNTTNSAPIAGNGSNGIILSRDLSAVWGITVNSTNSTGTQYLVGFGRGGSYCGGILSTGTNSTTYATSSDYRLKENIAPMTGALDKVAQLKPVTYKWKSDGSDGQGFIAHELQEVVPECVVGEKDAVDEEGNIKAQGVDTSFLVATLTAAIQELKAELDATKAEVQALKGVA